ncbi:15219_t:CDS:2 [Acaulospora colombiana]|uniref:15219_t:CDS:1 n=1 Tax=Acaulospora colombiana TaxID=27376 RepID=A0ACA9MT16_9GLOM|nr:15219_t:CDS:2 [Acaulospora colombiana]
MLRLLKGSTSSPDHSRKAQAAQSATIVLQSSRKFLSKSAIRVSTSQCDILRLVIGTVALLLLVYEGIDMKHYTITDMSSVDGSVSLLFLVCENADMKLTLPRYVTRRYFSGGLTASTRNTTLSRARNEPELDGAFRHGISKMKYKKDAGDKMDVDSDSTNDPNIDTLTKLLMGMEILGKKMDVLQAEVDKAKEINALDDTDEETIDTPTKNRRGGPHSDRENTLKRLRINVKKPMETWPTVSEDISKRYSKGDASIEGPNSNNFVLDWGTRATTQWTKDCAGIFARDFCSRHKSEPFPLLIGKVDLMEVENAFLTHILYLKRLYLKEKVDPIGAAADKGLMDQRSRSFRRRVALMKYHDFPSDSITMVKSLGVDGVSSEESDGESESGSDRIFKIKRLSWRSPDLTTFLRRIDELPLKKRGKRPLYQRRLRRRRVVADINSEGRDAVPSLPSNLYRTEWLQSLNERARKKLDTQKDAFVFPRIDDLVRRTT